MKNHIPIAIAVLETCSGVGYLTKAKAQVIMLDDNKSKGCWILLQVQGFPHDSTHGIHIHEFGDMSRGCDSLGPHWNPTGETHGTFHIQGMPRHAGDIMNNFTTDEFGDCRMQHYEPSFRIADVVGRSIVIHEHPDDCGLGGLDTHHLHTHDPSKIKKWHHVREESLLNGNSGKRIMCGVIGTSVFEDK